MEQIKLYIGTLFGAGLLPLAPGTWGSFFTLPVIYLTALHFQAAGMIILLSIAILLSLWSAPAAVTRYGDDPGRFVMDESAGQIVAFLAIPFHYSLYTDIWILLAGFLLFRLFDIFKPFGIRELEKISGKFGILFDDLLAGVYALICLQMILYVITVF
jgi:phosphatidylglycerophosphatase A